MKKKILIFTMLMAMVVAASVGCGSGKNNADGDSGTGDNSVSKNDDASSDAEAGGGNLVLYSTESDDLINLIVPGFEEKYGIKVEIITAGTGEMIKRIESEQSNPQGDVLLGASYLMAKNNEGLFEPYESTENQYVMDDYKFDGVTTYKAGCSVLLVNKDLIGDIQIKGYKDLLNPELKGRIAAADASASSSSFDHLVNMLVDMSSDGEYESEAAWNFVQDYLYAVDGKILNGSSAVHKGVADGEYAVGVTYEDPAASYIMNGATNLEVVYMDEGVVFFGSALNVIKGAKNMENAKLFVDYVLSEEIQNKFGTEACLRPVREGAKVGEHMKPLSDINVATVSNSWVSENQNALTAKWIDCMTNVN